MLILMSVISATAIFIIVILYIFKYTQKDKLKEEVFLKHRGAFLTHLRQCNKSKANKIDIIMKYDFSPYYLKELISSCKNNGGLIKETQTTVQLTEFGIKYYDRFVEPNG